VRLTNRWGWFLQVHNAIAAVGTQTAALCNACRTASTNIDDAIARRQLVQLAKDIANSTIGLVQAVKVRMSLLNLALWSLISAAVSQSTASYMETSVVELLKRDP
jgi:hypothetical protein